MYTLFGRDGERVRSLGEYDSTSYPPELRDLLIRREDVARELLRIDVTDRSRRAEALPRLQELLQKYPHPLVYEALIHAYLDVARFDDAKGVVFAAQRRRQECAGSEYPEIRAETESLRAWSPDEIDQLRKERPSH